MLGSAVIVFREVLEAALIIGLVLSVTRDVPGRIRYVGLGLFAGLSGAVVLALLADWIAPIAEGMGQELLNAGILLTAVVMLTWHLVWMKKHSQALVGQIRQIGTKIHNGEHAAPIIAVIIGLAILREGSEVVLFMYGLASAGASAASLLSGGVLGLLTGVLLGLVLYYGLMRIPLATLFRVSGLLLLLLTAGLAAQASSYLVQAGLLPALGYQVWDTSHILSEQSLPGQFLHIVVGYMAQPMGIQVLVYAASIGIISLLMYSVSKPLAPRMQRAVVSGLAGLILGALFVFVGIEVVHAF